MHDVDEKGYISSTLMDDNKSKFIDPIDIKEVNQITFQILYFAFQK